MNYGNKLTQFIPATQAMNLSDAVQFAWWQLYPLNLFITINLSRAGINHSAQAFITQYLKLAGDWLRLYQVGVHYVWALENPIGGLNLHVLIHWPVQHQTQLRTVYENGWFWQVVKTERKSSNTATAVTPTMFGSLATC